MGDNASAIKTIGLLVLVLIALGAALIFSYNPAPTVDLTPDEAGTPTSGPSETSVPPQAFCSDDDPSQVDRCCQDWAVAENVETPLCTGSWSWTQLGGCSYRCDNP
ncbi:hypothetical protein KC921_01130 [Candidatus Woesebacteria bacterium]|nr:hypothetical protein [Candidatus Woesebacteria bacterium]